jgi:CRISPR-associated protein Cmr1
MRFWFRALAGIVAGPDIRLLAGMEEEVFGSAQQPSPLMIRIPSQPAISQQPLQDARSTRPGGWSAYLLGPRIVTTTPRRAEIIPYVPPWQAFDICLKASSRGPFTEAATALAIASLWLACAYGGMGARARRGFGGLRITGAEGPIPAPWTPENIQSPGLGHYERISRLWPSGPVGDCVSLLGPLAERHGGRLALAQWKTPS